MSSVTLHHVNIPRDFTRVATVLHNFAVPIPQLVVAIWETLRHVRTKSIPTVSEEAQDLRDLAYKVSQSDPHFAQDMYAAAERHEWGDNAV